MKSIFNGLLEFKTNEDLNEFVKSISSENSLKIIELSLDFAHKSGVYTMEEVYIIYTSLLKLKKNENSVHSGNNSGDTNT